MMKNFKTSVGGAVVATALMWSTAAYAGPEGTYTIAGTNPGGSGAYKGTVNVVATGKVYEVVWNIANATYTGVGVLTDSDFSVAYYGTNLTGVAVYREQPDGAWKGVWAVKGSNRLGSEAWTPK